MAGQRKAAIMDKYRPVIGTRPPWAHRTMAQPSLLGRSDRFIAIAAELDRMADVELAHGHPRAAEHLTRKAQALREVEASA